MRVYVMFVLQRKDGKEMRREGVCGESLRSQQ